MQCAPQDMNLEADCRLRGNHKKSPDRGEILYRGIFMFETRVILFTFLREGMLRIRGMSRNRRSYLQLPTVHACSEPERHSR